MLSFLNMFALGTSRFDQEPATWGVRKAVRFHILQRVEFPGPYALIFGVLRLTVTACYASRMMLTSVHDHPRP